MSTNFQWVTGFKKDTKKTLEEERRKEFIRLLIANKYYVRRLDVSELEDILKEFNFTLTVEELLELLDKKK